MTTNLIPGQSTVADAAALYGVSIHRIFTVLHDSLTDVYVPRGDGGVISRHGRRYAWVDVTGYEMAKHEATELQLASDSIAVLAKYLPAVGTAPVVTAYVPTTELAEGDTIHNYGMVLRLTNRREYPADSDYRGIVVVFDGVVTNDAELIAAAKAGDNIAKFIWSAVRADMVRKGSDVPVWRVQGNRLATWLRVGP